MAPGKKRRTRSKVRNKNKVAQLKQLDSDELPLSPSASSRTTRSDSTDYETDTDYEDTDSEILYGFTQSGDRFVVPETHDTWTKLGRLHEIPTIVTWFCFGISLYIGLPDQFLGYPVMAAVGLKAYPPEYLFYLCIFWRLMYNITLGLILSYQSRTKGLTRLVSRVMEKKEGYLYNLLSLLVRGSTGCKNLNEKPAEFNAWILNTQLVNIILPNDVFAFCLFALREANFSIAKCGGIQSLVVTEAPTMLTTLIPQSIMVDSTCYVFYTLVYQIAIVLVVCSLYAKALSHKIIGYYAWFWGDFFFRIDKKLTFDGIFNVFPHPMYTVGYAWMYGLSILSGSFQVLTLTMISHCLQLFFLAYCGEPHILRTYGVEFPKTKRSHQENILIIKNFDPFRASDWSIVLLLIIYVNMTVIGGGVLGMQPKVSEHIFLLNAIVSTVIGRTALMILLYMQGKTRFWTRHFKSKNLTREDAFKEWKRLQNLLESVINISFIMFFWRVFQWPDSHVIESKVWFYISITMTALMLTFLSYWSATESYNALGDFGWFYGDFFVHFQPFSNDVGYIDTGIFRFFKHPDIVFGKCWMYALVLLSGSMDLAAVAMLHHALCLLQLVAIEEPHMKKVYKRHLKHAKKIR